MNKKFSKLFIIAIAIPWVISAVMIILGFVMKDKPCDVSYIYENGRISEVSWHKTYYNISGILFYICLFLGIAALLDTVLSKGKIWVRIVLILITELTAAALIYESCSMVTNGMMKEDPVYTKISSGSHTIVLEEAERIPSGIVYYIEGNSSARPIAAYDTLADERHDNIRDYQVEWFDDRVEITYKFASSDIEKQRFTAYFKDSVSVP